MSREQCSDTDYKPSTKRLASPYFGVVAGVGLGIAAGLTAGAIGLEHSLSASSAVDHRPAITGPVTPGVRTDTAPAASRELPASRHGVVFIKAR